MAIWWPPPAHIPDERLKPFYEALDHPERIGPYRIVRVLARRARHHGTARGCPIRYSLGGLFPCRCSTK